jgi:hypothetical protein
MVIWLVLARVSQFLDCASLVELYRSSKEVAAFLRDIRAFKRFKARTLHSYNFVTRGSARYIFCPSRPALDAWVTVETGGYAPPCVGKSLVFLPEASRIAKLLATPASTKFRMERREVMCLRVLHITRFITGTHGGVDEWAAGCACRSMRRAMRRSRREIRKMQHNNSIKRFSSQSDRNSKAVERILDFGPFLLLKLMDDARSQIK